MLQTKNFEIKKQVVSFILQGSNNEIKQDEKYDAVALALLTGFYNPMRKHFENDQPIDAKALYEFRQRFENLIYEVKESMQVDVSKFKKVS